MFRKRAIGKRKSAKPLFFFNHLHNSTRIENPEPQSTSQHADRLIRLRIYVWSVKLDPVKPVMLPFAQCPACGIKDGLARSKLNTVVVNNES